MKETKYVETELPTSSKELERTGNTNNSNLRIDTHKYTHHLEKETINKKGRRKQQPLKLG